MTPPDTDSPAHRFLSIMFAQWGTDDRGAAYAYQLLRDAGAPARLPLESGTAYVGRALREGPFRRFRHPGNLAYTWAVGRRGEHRTYARIAPQALPYPGPAAVVHIGARLVAASGEQLGMFGGPR